jgi:hypothetical protein
MLCFDDRATVQVRIDSNCSLRILLHALRNDLVQTSIVQGRALAYVLGNFVFVSLAADV